MYLISWMLSNLSKAIRIGDAMTKLFIYILSNTAPQVGSSISAMLSLFPSNIYQVVGRDLVKMSTTYSLEKVY